MNRLVRTLQWLGLFLSGCEKGRQNDQESLMLMNTQMTTTVEDEISPSPVLSPSSEVWCAISARKSIGPLGLKIY